MAPDILIFTKFCVCVGGGIGHERRERVGRGGQERMTFEKT